jgi:hypothetical protein
VALVREQTIATKLPSLVSEVSANLGGRGFRIVSATDPHSCSLDFLDRNRYYFFQVAPQLYSRA